MSILLTAWALDSYLDLLHAGVLNQRVVAERLRPDVLLIPTRDQHPRFKDASFWGPAQDLGGRPIPNGYKMKWHNLGNGNVQLRLCVALLQDQTWLCHGYTKTSPQGDLRESAKLKERIRLIQNGRANIKGVIQ